MPDSNADAGSRTVDSTGYTPTEQPSAADPARTGGSADTTSIEAMQYVAHSGSGGNNTSQSGSGCDCSQEGVKMPANLT
jgi:hypothetical protein